MATSHVKFMVPPSPRTKEEREAERQAHEDAQKEYERAIEESKREEVKDVVKISIESDDVGKFVGKGGIKVKDFVIKKTREMMDEKAGVVFCQIVTKKDKTVWARLKAKDEETMKILKENLEKHEGAFKKMKRFEGQSRFVFKVGMEHFKIAKFIGARGSNISEMKEKVRDADDSLTREDVYIQIKEDEKIKMKNMKFGELDCGKDIEQKVLITVSVYTNDRESSWAKIGEVVEGVVNEINGVGDTWGGKGAPNHELGEDDDPWDGDW